jgi:hypothetical protein
VLRIKKDRIVTNSDAEKGLSRGCNSLKNKNSLCCTVKTQLKPGGSCNKLQLKKESRDDAVVSSGLKHKNYCVAQRKSAFDPAELKRIETEKEIELEQVGTQKENATSNTSNTKRKR